MCNCLVGRQTAPRFSLSVRRYLCPNQPITIKGEEKTPARIPRTIDWQLGVLFFDDWCGEISRGGCTANLQKVEETLQAVVIDEYAWEEVTTIMNAQSLPPKVIEEVYIRLERCKSAWWVEKMMSYVAIFVLSHEA